MFYIHQCTCISPQHTFPDVDLEILNEAVDNKMKVVEPSYKDIPSGLLRRMGKAVRMGVGAGLSIINESVDGIVIGTANGGMEDCIKFLNQIIAYEEGMLTPGNFVQSTNNALAGQLGLMAGNKGYNITHVHRSLSFENAAIDVDMLLAENPLNTYLLGTVDEISEYNYNIEYLDGGYKREAVSNSELYQSETPGSIAGEGAAMFLVNAVEENAIARFHAIDISHVQNEKEVIDRLNNFLSKQLLPGEKIDVFLSGENGDSRYEKLYSNIERELLSSSTTIRFKHMCGEYPTASSFGFWLACNILKHQAVPKHAIKQSLVQQDIQKVLIYNNYKGHQHSFILMSRCQ